MNRWLPSLIVCLFSALGWAQTNIAGLAPVTLKPGVPDCNGDCVTVTVIVTLNGLSGTGGPAGLNGFVLAFDIDRSDVFASIRPGSKQLIEWDLYWTSPDLVESFNRLTIVGAAADPAAPDSVYELADIVLCGSTGPVTLTFVPGESSLGSRVIGGDGPGAIAIDPPPPFQTSVVVNFPLNFGDGIVAWMQTSPDYDLAEPQGSIDIADLVKLVNCGAP